MDSKFEEYIVNRASELQIKLSGYRYKDHYSNDDMGMVEKIRDRAKYEEIKELARNIPDVNLEELGRRIAEKVRQEISL